MPKQRIHIIIKGDVQGVFFRSETKKHADALNIKGWVRNNSDNSLEIIAEGEEENLKQLLNFCHKGPSSSQVIKIKIEKEEYKKEFDEFSVKY